MKKKCILKIKKNPFSSKEDIDSFLILSISTKYYALSLLTE